LLDQSSKENLQQGILEFRKLKDLNYESHKEGAVIRSAEFHPKSTVGLVAGLNGTASIFQVDGKNNPKIQTVNFENFPIKCAKFSTSGEEFLVGSQHHGHFFLYDMMAGKIVKIPWHKKTKEHNTQKFEVSPDGKLIAVAGRFGNIHLISAKTKELINTLKMNDDCHGLSFNSQGGKLYSHGAGGEVYIWDVRMTECLGKFTDDGCLNGSAIAVSGSHLAAGSNMGVVNIYSLADLETNNRPRPEKMVMNLTTQVNQLKFNPTGEVLAMSSEMKEGASKLVHFPSMTVFSNFPGTFNLNRVNCLGWSPAGGYLALGNNKGAANLYRMKHYVSY
jgi:U3 small nucleolar RNA-associated protein 18